MPTNISWTDETWNSITGCSRASEGCRFCYAESLSLRFGWSQQPWTASNAKDNIILHPERLQKPYTWKKPCRVFVNSMSDCFHELVPDDFLAEMFAVMNALPQHTFQILTKRPERMAAWRGPWTSNIWVGTSIENRRALARIDALRQCPAHIRFLSCEPLLEDLGEIHLAGVQWVIAGGESGKHIPSRPDRQMQHAWARNIRNQCVAANPPIAFYFKQSSGIRSEMGTELEEEDGSHTIWRQFPDEQQMSNNPAPVQMALFG